MIGSVPTPPPSCLPGWLPVILAALLVAAPCRGQAQCGDCDGDGQVSVTDALTAAQDASGLIVVPPVRRPACDVDSSSVITVLDALAIAQVAAGLTVPLVCQAGRVVTSVAAVPQLGAAAYTEQVLWSAGANPLVLVEPGETQQLVLEANFAAAPSPVDVAAGSNPDGTTTYALPAGPGGVTVSPDGLLTAGAANGCTMIEVTFTPDGVTSTGAPMLARFAACVDLGGPDDDPRGDRASLLPGEVDLTLPGLPGGPVIPAAGGTFDIFVEIQAGATPLGGYQLLVQWSPQAPALQLDPTFGSAGPSDFGVSNRDPVTGLPLSALDFGPIVNSDNALGRSNFLDVNGGGSLAPVGVVRVAVMRFESPGGVMATATISGTIQGVADIPAMPLGAPTPRPLVAGAGDFELP